jgi:hypothetical protein
MKLPSIKKIGLSLAIIITLNVFFNVGLETFYPEPQYDDFCENRQDRKGLSLEDELTCETNGGDWVATTESEAYCDNQSCFDTYDDEREYYARNAFIILTVLGVISVAMGLFMNIPSAVLIGFLYGGVISLLTGTMRYWSYMDDYLQFIVSGVALAILIGIGVKKLKD